MRREASCRHSCRMLFYLLLLILSGCPSVALFCLCVLPISSPVYFSSSSMLPTRPTRMSKATVCAKVKVGHNLTASELSGLICQHSVTAVGQTVMKTCPSTRPLASLHRVDPVKQHAGLQRTTRGLSHCRVQVQATKTLWFNFRACF